MWGTPVALASSLHYSKLNFWNLINYVIHREIEVAIYRNLVVEFKNRIDIKDKWFFLKNAVLLFSILNNHKKIEDNAL